MKYNNVSYYRTIMDAIPLWIFVVDEDLRIFDLNKAAAKVFDRDKKLILKVRGGEILHCLHSYEVPEGCGRAPSCRNCIIRNSVKKSLKGQTVSRRRTKVELKLGKKTKNLELFITASRLPDIDERLSLLVIEDITEISTLHDIIPICANCKKIRDDQEYWHSVERYFKDNIGVDFSHGICPDCKKKLYPDYLKPKRDAKGIKKPAKRSS
jgi:hypothetical protein